MEINFKKNWGEILLKSCQQSIGIQINQLIRGFTQFCKTWFEETKTSWIPLK